MMNSMIMYVVMMVVILFIKWMNTTVKMMIDTVEMMKEMITIVKRNCNKSGMMNMLVIVLIMKVVDTMIDNTIAFYIEVMKVMMKIVNVTEVVETIEIVFITVITCIMYVTDVLMHGTTESTTDGIVTNTTRVTTIISVITAAAVKNLKSKTETLSDMYGWSGFTYHRTVIPLC